MIVNVHQAKSQLSKLLDAVERGEEVIITRRGNGIGRYQIVPAPLPDRALMFGALKGKFEYSDEEWAAAYAEVEDMFNESLERNERNCCSIPRRLSGCSTATQVWRRAPGRNWVQHRAS